MASETVALHDPNDFEEKLAILNQKSLEKGVPFFVLFTGAKNETTGVSWCPDCVRADPLIQQALGEITEGYILLEVSVVREEFRATDYKFRVDPQLKLNCVPTLLKWGRSGPIARLNDAQSQDIELVRELVVA